MTSPISKTKQAIAHFNRGDLKAALGVVSTWRPSSVVSPAQLAVLKRGRESMLYPDFQRQLGRDPLKQIEEARALFSSLFIKEVVHV